MWHSSRPPPFNIIRNFSLRRMSRRLYVLKYGPLLFQSVMQLIFNGAFLNVFLRDLSSINFVVYQTRVDNVERDARIRKKSLFLRIITTRT
jgi:hypothetical protein